MPTPSTEPTILDGTARLETAVAHPSRRRGQTAAVPRSPAAIARACSSNGALGTGGAWLELGLGRLQDGRWAAGGRLQGAAPPPYPWL